MDGSVGWSAGVGFRSGGEAAGGEVQEEGKFAVAVAVAVSVCGEMSSQFSWLGMATKDEFGIWERGWRGLGWLRWGG